MPSEPEIQLLVITGTVGVGKSAVLDEIHDVLCSVDSAHACIDVDALSHSWPMRGEFNRISMLENLRCLWANYRAAGAVRVALAGVVERSAELADYREAIPGARITVCRLFASEATRVARVRTREIGSGLRWHMRRTVELEAALVAAALHDFEVLNEARSVRDVALEVLGRAGWLTELATPPRG